MGDLSEEQTKARLKRVPKDVKGPKVHLVDVLIPEWKARAQRNHQIMTDPHTPIYHAVCRERKVYPFENLDLRLSPLKISV